jgi:hypothetical protein
MARPVAASTEKLDFEPPQVDGSNWIATRPGAGEIVFAYYDERGGSLRSHAMRGAGRAFVDREPVSAAGEPRSPGFRYAPSRDERLLDVPVPTGSRYLSILRTRVVSREQLESYDGIEVERGDGAFGEVVFGFENLAVYDLVPPGSSTPPSIPPELPFPVPGFSSPPRLDTLSTISLPPGGPPPEVFQCGWVDSEETYIDSGPVAETFNIVITGDGFHETECIKFDDAAKTVIHGLFGGEDQSGIEPFAHLAAQVNVRIVRAISYRRGVPHGDEQVCSHLAEPDETLNTCYRVSGCFPVEGTEESCSSYCGTFWPQLIYRAARNFAPLERVHLFLVIVNSDAAGGSAFPDQRIAFVTTGERPEHLIHYAAHEAAHVIGDLADEYISPVEWDGVPVHLEANVAHRDQMNTIWWRTDPPPGAQAAPTAAVAAVPAFEIWDCATEATCVTEHNLAPSRVKSLGAAIPYSIGLYWGAQYIDDASQVVDIDAFDDWGDKLGVNYFRSHARCKMRHEWWDFCPVCAYLLEQAILSP